MLRDSLVFIAALLEPALYAKLGPYQPKHDYVGPEAWTKRKALKPLARLARYAYGVDFNVAGWVHDQLYLLGGGELERSKADAAFLTIMLWLIEQHPGKGPVGMLQRHLARLRAQTLYHFVREQGCHFFTYSGVTHG
jgi:hypothetical protein